MSEKAELLADRLSGILYRLNTGEQLSVHDLAREYNVTVRTIQKDLNSRLVRLPILRNEYGLYVLDSSYLGKFKLDDIKLLIHASGNKGLYPELNHKLISTLLRQYNQETIKVIGHNYEEIDDRTEDFYRLQDFILKHQTIKFLYNEKDYREMKPYRLINQSGIWYLAAEDSESELKSFHFKKLKRIAFTGNYFQPKPEIHAKIEESDSIWFEGEVETVTLEVSAEIAPYFKRRQILPRQTIVEEKSDGSLTVETRTGNMKMLIPKIMYWIPELKILKPESLNKQLIKKMNQYIKMSLT